MMWIVQVLGALWVTWIFLALAIGGVGMCLDNDTLAEWWTRGAVSVFVTVFGVLLVIVWRDVLAR